MPVTSMIVLNVNQFHKQYILSCFDWKSFTFSYFLFSFISFLFHCFLQLFRISFFLIICPYLLKFDVPHRNVFFFIVFFFLQFTQSNCHLILTHCYIQLTFFYKSFCDLISWTRMVIHFVQQNIITLFTLLSQFFGILTFSLTSWIIDPTHFDH